VVNARKNKLAIRNDVMKMQPISNGSAISDHKPSIRKHSNRNLVRKPSEQSELSRHETEELDEPETHANKSFKRKSDNQAHHQKV